jgi:hypothetical protein
MRAAMPFAPRRIGADERGLAQLSVNGMDRKPRARHRGATGEPARVATLPHRPDRTSTCASNMNSKPRGAAALRAAARSLRADGSARCRFRAFRHWRASREAPAVLFLEGIGVACSFRQGRRAFAPDGFGSDIRLVPVVVSGNPNGGRAGCPNATQPEPVTVSVPFLRPRVGNWQAGCGALPQRKTIFVMSARDFRRDLSFN